jgi:flagellar hook-basal body complex protein FliE
MNAIPAFRALQAAAAYQNVDGVVSSDMTTAAPSSGGDFASMLSQSLGSAINTSESAEAQAKTAINGGGDLTSVVTAVSRAELALQTTVAVRDRVLQAYQDIIKMSI